MKTLRMLLESERIILPKNDVMINQLRSLERSYTEQGTVRFKHVGQAHDDVAWALALCVKDCTNQNIEIAYKAMSDIDSISHLDREERRELRNIVLVS
jgi:phage FluMu gp28-like protein